MCKEGQNKKAEAIVSGLWLVVATVLMFHFFEIKMVIESISQDYPSFGMNLISKWAPLFFPLPYAYYLLRESFPPYKKIFDSLFCLMILFILAAIIKIYFTNSISWEMFWSDLRLYFMYIFLGGLLAYPPLKTKVVEIIDQAMGWS